MYHLLEKATNYQEREKGKTQPGTLCKACYRRAVKDEREGIHVTRKTNANLGVILIYERWSGPEQCWILELEI